VLRTRAAYGRLKAARSGTDRPLRSLATWSCSYNLIIKGIPDKAVVRDTGETEVIGYTHMRDTIKPFGEFSKMHLIRGTLYVQFREETSCVACHSLLNNMQMGENIITTLVV